MKKGFLLICFLSAFLFSGCEDKWGDDTMMRYVIDIQDDGSGGCTYLMAPKRNDKTSDFSIPAACGAYKIGEGFFTPQ